MAGHVTGGESQAFRTLGFPEVPFPISNAAEPDGSSRESRLQRRFQSPHQSDHRPKEPEPEQPRRAPEPEQSSPRRPVPESEPQPPEPGSSAGSSTCGSAAPDDDGGAVPEPEPEPGDGVPGQHGATAPGPHGATGTSGATDVDPERSRRSRIPMLKTQQQ